MAIVAVVTLALDQLTKEWALRALGDGQVRPLIGDWITLRLLRNPGAAFSFGDSNTLLTTLIAVVVTVLVLVWSRRLNDQAWAWAFGLIVGGSLGNLVDRLVRDPGPGRGHVVDFIDYFGWFVGNVADIAIVGAAVAIAVFTAMGLHLDGSREGSDEHPSATDV
ncbi:signal peptidase II [Kribbia dieselivorans]|uniref:signal peptidase II n=1 Tax=Kribbia dieselivorans TaxID=331526 RepID=UPI000838BD26|nr:signal peptidase II [Kribbia dieselivorans]